MSQTVTARALLEPLESRRLLSAGDHDLTYGENGFLTMRFGSTPYQFMPGSDPNGVATTVSMTRSQQSFMLRKFNNGVPDTSVGRGGVFAEATLPFIPRGRSPAPARIWSLSGGRTLIEFIFPNTLTSNDAYFVRLKADNTIDRTYGDNGSVFFNGRFPLEAAQQGDKLLTLPGTIGASVMSRFNDDGTVDATFGTNGILKTDKFARRLLVQPDGKILAAAWFISTPKVYRYTADGQLDTTFGGGDGKAVAGYERGEVFGMALDSAGRIIVAGTGGVARLRPDGLLDLSFGDKGVSAPAGEVVIGNELAIAPFGGSRLVKVDASGNQDAAFGRVIVDLGLGQARPTLADAPIDRPQSVKVQPDGSVLVGHRFADGRFVQIRIDEGGNDPGPITQAGLGQVSITGTEAPDQISIEFGSLVDATLNGIGRAYERSTVGNIIASGGGSADIMAATGFGAHRPVTLFGGAGDDVLRGGDGSDLLNGMKGDDALDGGNRADTLTGSDGNDTISGGAQSDHITGDAGRDRLLGGAGHDRIFGGESGDRLYGQGGDDQLNGEGGNDRIYGDDLGLDTLHGNAGDDLLVSRDSLLDHLFGDGGRDSSVADNIDQLTSIELKN